MMPKALWLLLGLSARAKVRNGIRQLRNPRQALFAVFGIGLTGTTLFLPVFLQCSSDYWSWRIDPILVREVFSSLLAIALVTTLFLEQPIRGLRFTPAEEGNFFPAPFSRRQVLVYKLIAEMGSAAVGGCFIGFWLDPFSTLIVPGFMAGFLWGVLIDLVQVLRQLVARYFEMSWLIRAGRLTRRMGLVVLLFLLGREIKMVRHLDFPSALHAVQLSRFGSIVFALPSWFADMALAKYLSTFLYFALAASLTIALIPLLVFWLDSLSRYEFGEAELQGIAQKRPKTGKSMRTLSGPRWCNGIGPIFWKQSLSLLRKFNFLQAYGPMLLFIEGSFALISHISGELPPIGAAIVAGSVSLSSIFVMTTMFDFRSELNQMEVLKGLPLSATSIVLSEILPLVALGTLLNLVHLILLALLFYGLRWELLEAFFIAPSFLLLLVGFENAAFLLIPIRIKPAKASGFGEANRTAALLVLKICVFFAFVILFVGAGWYLRMNGIASNALFFVTSFVSVTIAGILMCCGVVAVFKRFDVATDIPH
jgi:hypothetical protein